MKIDVYNMLCHGVSANTTVLWESKKSDTSSISKILKTAAPGIQKQTQFDNNEPHLLIALL